MSNLGFGLSAFGTSIYGFGSPEISNSTTKKEFILDDGTNQRGNIEKIDPLTLDYVLTEEGLHVGEKSVKEQVRFALFTKKDSSSLADFGLDLSSIQVITDDTEQKFRAAVNEALAHLVNKGAISIQSVSYRRIKPNALQLTIEWIDLSSGERNFTKLTPGI